MCIGLLGVRITLVINWTIRVSKNFCYCQNKRREEREEKKKKKRIART